MSAEDLLRDGNLAESLRDLQDQVRNDPSNSKHRIFLFQLLAVLGQWERALTQLNVLADLDAEALAMVQTYREALRCEALRGEIFAGRRSALVFGEPEQWLALQAEALRLMAAGESERSGAIREQAFEAAPTTTGTLWCGDGEGAGQEFEWICDADMRLGPVLEAIVNGRYYWIPVHRIAEVALEPPADLRDLVWTPANFRWANGGEAVGLIPTRYAGTETSEADPLRLARRTEWNEHGDGTYVGCGQRMLATDEGEFPLLEIRRIRMAPIPAESDVPAPEPGDG